MPMEYDKRRPRLPVELAARVDGARGQVSFNAFVVQALENALKAGPRTPLTDGEHDAIESARAGLDATPFADAVARMPRQQVPAIKGLRPARQYVKPFNPRPKGS